MHWPKSLTHQNSKLPPGELYTWRFDLGKTKNWFFRVQKRKWWKIGTNLFHWKTVGISLNNRPKRALNTPGLHGRSYNRFRDILYFPLALMNHFKFLIINDNSSENKLLKKFDSFTRNQEINHFEFLGIFIMILLQMILPYCLTYLSIKVLSEVMKTVKSDYG